MRRHVLPETLDVLAPSDPDAVRSRADLRRVHRVMRTRSIVLRALRSLPVNRARRTPLRVLELGAGDGSLMLDVARRLAPAWPPVSLTLLDQHDLIQPGTVRDYAALRWQAQVQVDDVLHWAGVNVRQPKAGRSGWDLIVANLFLHHFEGAALKTLLHAVAERSTAFFACEPRRAWVPLAGSHLIGALGANAVTRQDAVLSVHAGFRNDELSTFWPTHTGAWRLGEYDAGLFSHCLLAQRARRS